MSWQRAVVAEDRTHHVVGDRPLYADRFDEVLAFHAPGLAPVRLGFEAWHIDEHAGAAYARRFERTFGFYDGRATVVSVDGWHHIGPDGVDAHGRRFAWCGNFQQGRCTVRDRDGRYFHVSVEGRDAYARRWRYAGDYRDGRAVVQDDDGRSTHVDMAGDLAHGRWFRDLDVFHKGAARARDEDGWTHIANDGRPLYARRFAMVEPFYNGQSRVERFDGGLEVIDESGRAIVQLRAAEVDDFHALSASLVGYWSTQTLATAVRLGVFEHLPGVAADVAHRCGLSAPALTRLLRGLEELRVVRCDGEHWSVTERGAFLRVDHPRSLATAALEYAGPLSEAWNTLDEALRAERPRATNVFHDVAGDPARCATHHRMLESYARHDYAPLVSELPIRAGEVVVDVGGGNGALAELIADAFPSARVVVIDLPEVAALAGIRASRVEAIAADFFLPWPVTADVVVLARVLHDWADEDAVRILRRAAESLRPGGRIVVVEMLIDFARPTGALCDLHLLAVTGGRERSLDELRALFQAARLRVDRVVVAESPARIVVAAKP